MTSTDTTLIKRIKGHTFGVEVSEPTHAGDLANGARGFDAKVSFYREGKLVGAGQWEPEGFADCVDLRGQPLDLCQPCPDVNENDVYYALETEVRGYLARIEPQRKKPERVEPEQTWRVDGEELEVVSVDDGWATLRVRTLATGEWVTWGRAPVSSMLTMRCWAFVGTVQPEETGGIALAL
jgi:hypothetical protein